MHFTSNMLSFALPRIGEAALSLFTLFQSNSDTSGSGCGIGFLIVLGIIIAVLVSESNKKAKALREAREAYYRSLDRLKSDPTNPGQRQGTLRLGRAYSNLTRNKRGVTLFDEVALMNDISAACAGATTVSHEQSRTTNIPSIEERLAILSELRSKGLIDQQEYNLRRERILDEV